MLATMRGHTACVHALIAARADFEARSPVSRPQSRAAVAVCVSFGSNASLVWVGLRQCAPIGGRIDAFAQTGWTAAIIAAANASTDALVALIAARADVNAVENVSRSAVWMAALTAALRPASRPACSGTDAIAVWP